VSDSVKLIQSGKQDEKKNDLKIERKTIENWQQELKIKPYLFVASCLKNKWASGKMVTETEFKKGLELFLKSKAGDL